MEINIFKITKLDDKLLQKLAKSVFISLDY